MFLSNLKYILFLKRLKISIFVCLFTNVVNAQQELYKEDFFVRNGDTLKYRILYPKDFSKDIRYPLVLFLHGAGGRGNENHRQLIHGRKLFASEEIRENFPAIIVLPQCPKEDYWSNATVDRSTYPFSLTFPENDPPTKSMSLVMDFMDSMIAKPYVSKEQVYVGGLSMGGMGTFEILSRKPDMFAAAFAICGAGNPILTKNYAQKVPLWIFHGAKDNVIKPQCSMDMVLAIIENGGTPNFNLYADDNHNSWDSAFSEPYLIPWLFSKSK